MINLLPASIKSDIKAARANSVVIRYILILTVSAVLLGLGCLFVYMVDQSALDTAKSTVKPSANSNSSSSSSQLATANDYKAKLQYANDTVIKNQINYSKLLTSIGGSMPAGVIIDTLDLSSTSFGTGIKILAYAVSDSSANLIISSLSSSQAFSSVNVDKRASLPTPMYEKYTLSVELTVSLNKGIQ
jgi:hypothetical protein